jgi:hypothetical protein
MGISSIGCGPRKLTTQKSVDGIGAHSPLRDVVAELWTESVVGEELNVKAAQIGMIWQPAAD